LIDLFFPEIVYLMVGFTLGIGFEAWSRKKVLKRRERLEDDLAQSDIIMSRSLQGRRHKNRPK
jgi:hypothetical protein